MSVSKPSDHINEGTPQVDSTRLSERPSEPHSTLSEVWVKTKDLGWFRSAVRSTPEAAEEVAAILRRNFEVEIR